MAPKARPQEAIHDKRGINGMGGWWISEDYAKSRSVGKESWWLEEFRGRQVEVKQYDPIGPAGKPIWMYENGDFYLGPWAYTGPMQYPLENGFGITYNHYPPTKVRGKIHIGHYRNGKENGDGKSHWLVNSSTWKRNFLPGSPIRQWDDQLKRQVSRPFCYIGNYENGKEEDPAATAWLKDGTVHVDPWENGKVTGSWWRDQCRAVSSSGTNTAAAPKSGNGNPPSNINTNKTTLRLPGSTQVTPPGKRQSAAKPDSVMSRTPSTNQQSFSGVDHHQQQQMRQHEAIPAKRLKRDPRAHGRLSAAKDPCTISLLSSDDEDSSSRAVPSAAPSSQSVSEHPGATAPTAPAVVAAPAAAPSGCFEDDSRTEELAVWLSQKVLIYARMSEVEGYARKLDELGFDSKEMVMEHCTSDLVKTFGWMKMGHQFAFSKWLERADRH